MMVAPETPHICCRFHAICPVLPWLQCREARNMRLARTMQRRAHELVARGTCGIRAKCCHSVDASPMHGRFRGSSNPGPDLHREFAYTAAACPPSDLPVNLTNAETGRCSQRPEILPSMREIAIAGRRHDQRRTEDTAACLPQCGAATFRAGCQPRSTRNSANSCCVKVTPELLQTAIVGRVAPRSLMGWSTRPFRKMFSAHVV